MLYEISMRATGFIISMALTLAAYFLILNPEFLSPNVRTTVLVIFIFALIQSLVQLIFFIDVWDEGQPRWNLVLFISTVGIIFIVIFFSIWIMNHLNYNMH